MALLALTAALLAFMLRPDPASPRYILTEPWLGYRFYMPGADAELTS